MNNQCNLFVLFSNLHKRFWPLLVHFLLIKILASFPRDILSDKANKYILEFYGSVSEIRIFLEKIYGSASVRISVRIYTDADPRNPYMWYSCCYEYHIRTDFILKVRTRIKHGSVRIFTDLRISVKIRISWVNIEL